MAKCAGWRGLTVLRETFAVVADHSFYTALLRDPVRQTTSPAVTQERDATPIICKLYGRPDITFDLVVPELIFCRASEIGVIVIDDAVWLNSIIERGYYRAVSVFVKPIGECPQLRGNPEYLLEQDNSWRHCPVGRCLVGREFMTVVRIDVGPDAHRVRVSCD